MTISDLYHDQAPYLINYFQSPTNEILNAGAEPVPNATLINEAQNVHFNITLGQTYLFRIINMGVFASQWLQFDQHEMTVVEIDGVYTQPYNVSQLFITVAQRYSVIVKAKADKSRNFAIVASMSTDMFNQGVTPPNLQNNVSFQNIWRNGLAHNGKVTSWLVYDPAKPLPPPFDMQLQPFDDTLFIPYDQQPLLGPVTYP
jgi:iron transport multicopper oxidase